MSVLDSVKHKIEKALKKLEASLEKKIKDVGKKAVHDVEGAGKKATHAVESAAHSAEHQLNSVADDLEYRLKEIGDEIVEGLQQGFGDLIELAESGVLKPALEKIADYAEEQVFEGSAPIPLRTAYLDIEVTDAKALARTIRSMIQNGLPTSKSQWRHIIVDLAPKAIAVKPGIPLIAQLVNRIDLEGLETSALDKLLREAGLE